MSNQYKAIWNQLHKEFASKNQVKYDDWLDGYKNIIKNTILPIVDLGCGSTANNTQYLLERGKRVISCDFSEEAINIVSKIKGSQTMLFDMLDGLPFDDNSTDVVVADLCLHCFTEKDSFRIISEIKRILTSRGHLLLRLNSVNSTEFKNLIKNNAKQIEPGLYFANNMEKRFFEEIDIRKFFQDWQILELSEENMTRWSPDKIVWKCVVQNKKIV